MPPQHSPEIIAQIIAHYTSGLNYRQISEKIGVSENSAYRYVHKSGVSRRALTDTNRRYPLNDMVFESPSAEGRYWLGFILADGCVEAKSHGHDRDRLTVTLASRDAEHVGALRAFLECSIPIQHSRRANGHAKSTFAVCSARLVSSLLRWQIEPRKSFTAEPHPQLANCSHFWRGVVDGDGSLHWKNGRPVLSLVGSLATCEALVRWADTSAAGATRVSPIGPRCPDIYSLRYHGRDAITLAGLLYCSGSVALRRKAELAAEFAAVATQGADWRGISRDKVLEVYSRVHSWAKVAAELGVSADTLRAYRKTRFHIPKHLSRERICSVPECGRRHWSRGFCSWHYDHVYRSR